MKWDLACNGPLSIYLFCSRLFEGFGLLNITLKHRDIWLQKGVWGVDIAVVEGALQQNTELGSLEFQFHDCDWCGTEHECVPLAGPMTNANVPKR